MLRQTGGKYFLKPRGTKMKMKVAAIHIVLTSHSSTEVNCFFMRIKKEFKSSEGPGPALCCPAHKLLPAQCWIAAWWDALRYPAASREQWVLQRVTVVESPSLEALQSQPGMTLSNLICLWSCIWLWSWLCCEWACDQVTLRGPCHSQMFCDSH